MKQSKTNTSLGRKVSARPGVRLRGQMAEVYEARGHSTGKLWMQYSSKAGRDVAFASEIGYLHFLYVESSFDVKQVNYTPKMAVEKFVGSGFVDFVTTVISRENGDVVWRHLCAANSTIATEQKRSNLQLLLQCSYTEKKIPMPIVEVLTHDEMLASPQRIRNWHRVAAWLAAGRDWGLTQEQLEVAALIRSKKRVEFQEVLALGKATERADLYGVAILRSLQAGAYCSNLFDAPFTTRTVFTEKQEML